MIKGGDVFDSWFTGDREDGQSSVLAVYPYTGRYPEYFNCVLLLGAKNTGSKTVEQAYYDPDRAQKEAST